MKKILILSAFFIFACSSDDSLVNVNDNNDNNVTENSLLAIKRTRTTDSFNIEYNYTYSGTQIISYITETITEAYTDVSTTTYTYTNNVITASNTVTERDGEFYSSSRYTYEYDEFDRLIKDNRIDEDGNIIWYYTYSHLQNGSVQRKREDGTLIDLYLYDELGRLYEIVRYDIYGQVNGGRTWTFDNKNSPFKNVTTWRPRSFLTASNFINYLSTYNYNGCLYEYTTTYNDDNYPTSVQITNCDGEIISETFEYITL